MRRDDVQKEIGGGRSREGPIVGEAEVLVVGRAEHQGGARGDVHVGKTVVIVQADCRDEVHPVAQRRLRVQIRAGFGDDVVVLVPPGDRTSGARLGPLPIDAVNGALPGSDIEAVLKLGRHGARPVHHRAAGPQQECSRFRRSSRCSAPGVGLVQERLGEEPTLRQARLDEVVAPVLHLAGTDPRH